MENYFDVPKILRGQEPDVKTIGGPSTPLNSVCRRSCRLIREAVWIRKSRHVNRAQWRRSAENTGGQKWVGTGEGAGQGVCLLPHISGSSIPENV